MNRLTAWHYGAAIGEALRVVPPGIADRLRHVEFLTGTDPLFAGLHGYDATTYGRSLRSTMHCAYRHHTSDRTTTIVIPQPEEPHLVVHELGHALDEVLGWRHPAAPVTGYARTDRQEAFAESFVAWLYDYGDQQVALLDLPTIALFGSLA